MDCNIFLNIKYKEQKAKTRKKMVMTQQLLFITIYIYTPIII